MKVLFSGKVSYADTEKIINDHVKKNEYKMVYSKEINDSKEYAIYSSKIDLLRIDIEYISESDLHELRIVKIPINVGEDNEYKILGTKKIDDLKISQVQVKILISALNEYVRIIKGTEYIRPQKQILANNEIKNAEKLKVYLEDSIGYNYEEALEKCKIKSSKKNDMLGLGLGGFEQLIRKK